MGTMQKSVIGRLKELDSQSVPFYEANKKLLAEGFSEEEILEGIYNFSYDGKPNEIKKPDKIKEFYDKNPQAAKEMADYLLKQLAEEIRYEQIGRAASNFAASRIAPGHHAKAHYSLKFHDDAGLPFFSTLLVIGIATAIVFQFDLPTYLIYIAPGVYLVIFMLIRYLMHR